MDIELIDIVAIGIIILLSTAWYQAVKTKNAISKTDDKQKNKG